MRIKMKKFAYTILLGASALIAACTALPREEQVTLQGNPEEVAFSAYLNRSTTKAGAVGLLNNTALADNGFGVFGYHTDNALYSQAALPNFMYNTKVSGTPWQYSPIKYWPNEYGENASSEAIDRLTFFAYAPYVKVNSATGALDGTEYDNTTPEKSTTTGITRLTRATDTGDPLVSYVVSFNPASSVDLTWGVAKDAFNKSAGTSEGTNAIAQGDPYINVARPNTGDKIAFSFEHALASLNVQIKSDLAGGATHDATQTKVYVRSVKFEGFAGEGSLNLNSKKGAPQWVNYYGNGALSTESVTIYDGRRDGREATSADANEKPSDLNPVIVQSAAYDDVALTAGVTTTAVNLFNPGTGGVNSPIYVIPTGDVLKVTIAYDVETIDEKILGTFLADGATHGSVVENTISKTITGITMEAGKKYVITLNLGLNSVDFEADIEAWGTGEEAEADLPASSGIAMSFTSGGVSVTAPMMLWGTGSETRTAVADLPDGYTLSGAVTYSSSDPDVAYVDASTGEVTAIGPGEATIIATAVATKASETSASGSYKVYVNAIESILLESSSNVFPMSASATLNTTINFVGGGYGIEKIDDWSFITYNNTPSSGSSNISLTVLSGLETSAVGSAYGGKHAIVSASVPAAYSSSGEEIVSNKVYLACAPLGSTGGTFNGYYISSGNLQYQASTDTWRIAEKQYDYVGSASKGNVYVGEVKSDNSLASSDYSGWIDLFGWGTSGWPNTGEGSSNVESWISYAPWSRVDYGTGTAPYYQTSFGPAPSKLGLIGTYANGDWAVYNQITYKGAYIDEGWKTPTSTDVTASFLLDYIKATVNSIQGVIVLPSDFDLCKPAEIEIASRRVANSSFAANNFDLSAWEKMEAIGCAFLPCSGRCWNNTVGDVLTAGNYWTTSGPTQYPDIFLSMACCLSFNSSNVAKGDGMTSSGGAVRIIYKY